jgi:hypothetical protein
MAANPILQKLAGLAGNNPGGLAQAVNMVTGMLSGMKGKDPSAMLKLMAAQNPSVKQALDLVEQNGGNAEAAFRALAEKNGMDPDQIIGALRNAGLK